MSTSRRRTPGAADLMTDSKETTVGRACQSIGRWLKAARYRRAATVVAAASLVIAGMGMSVNPAPAAAEFGFADGVLAEFHEPQDVGVLELLGKAPGRRWFQKLQAGGHPDLTVAFDFNWIENTQSHYVVPER